MDIASARHAFVTGGASGIGRGIADALARHGVAVTIADIDAAAIEVTLAERSGAFGGAVLDVRDREGWRTAKQEAEQAFGPVDVLVNNAGIGFNGTDFADLDPRVFDTVIDIDITGVFNGVSAFASDLRERGHGHIVNTASVMGLTAGVPGRGVYSAAKAAVVSMSEALRAELAPHGVGVSVLCPGLVRSGLDDSTARLGGEVRQVEHIKGGNAGMAPETAGEIVVRGISLDVPYILTHPHYLENISTRFGSIVHSAEAVHAGA
ncbi:SDR family oxidoreductase [Rhodococcus sp. NPDC047139]|uniref:SDR family oxidoreductase n=1 Tax=Rhodococcus sp. NPDC047139 TaxID=3155141 RepID=UPI0033F4ED9E